MRRTHWIMPLVILATACSSGETLPPPPSPLVRSGEPVVFLGDPQLHNMYGSGLFQSGPTADIFVPVARRPPELNILSPYTLETLILRSRGETNALMVVLGDASNIACSGEISDFHRVVNRAMGGGLWLAAHGNHDTYMMGTVNSFIPADDPDWNAPQVPSAPTNESWWGSAQTPELNSRLNWRDACYRPAAAGEGSPMNKVRWIASYLEQLERSGLVREAGQVAGSSSGDAIALHYSATPGSELGRRNFQARGLYVPPVFGDRPSRSNFTRSYRSFIVQGVDLTPKHRLIIIDTSVCEHVRIDLGFPQNNAGSKACIGEEQLGVIRSFVSEAPSGSAIVAAGHFPLDYLEDEERDALIEIFSSRPGWRYMSGHTHRRLSEEDWETGDEINIGSTTDWPLEAHRFHLPAEGNAGWTRESFYVSQDPRIGYRPVRTNVTYELCRHLNAAAALAALNPATAGTRWSSPAPNDCVRTDADWSVKANELHAHLETIRRRYEAEPEYRALVLEIAAEASRVERLGRSIP